MGNAGSTSRVSLITISGNIPSFTDVKEQINSAFNQPNLKAVCLKINSPGGCPAQSHLIAEYIKCKAKKTQVPVFCFAENLAASGGYLVACAASMIFVSRFSNVGSIGVTMTSYSVTKLLDMLGIESKVFTAGSLKGGLSPLTSTTVEEELYIKNLLNEVHQEFIKFVKENRAERLALKESNILFSGAVFGARRAIELGLVDGLYTVLEDKVGELIEDKKFKLVQIKNKDDGSGLENFFGFASKIIANYCNKKYYNGMISVCAYNNFSK